MSISKKARVPSIKLIYPLDSISEVVAAGFVHAAVVWRRVPYGSNELLLAGIVCCRRRRIVSVNDLRK